MSGGASGLRVSGLHAGYGDLRVLTDVNLAARAGTVTAVLGANGAGKTTLLSAVAGLMSVGAGSVHLDDHDITRVPSHARAALGLALVQEGKRVFRRLTIHENLTLAGYRMGRQARQVAIDQAYEQFPMLAEKRGLPAGAASGGQQQMLAIAQALMPSPKVLMLDEPSAGLAPIIVNEVIDVIRELKGREMAIVLVEQLVDKALSVADHVIALQHGQVVVDEPAERVSADELEDAYFGN